MSNFPNASHAEIFSFCGNLQRELRQCATYEAAAQHLMDRFYESFVEDLVLARTYVTVSYRALPLPNQQFVDRLASSKNLTLHPDVPVLSLVGTRGCKSAWNSRRQSVGHLGIPLASSDFVAALPMIARLLSDFEIELHWLDRPERGISTALSGWSGLFHVADARTSRDQYQRLIIPAQDFVIEQDVRTVFGVGGSYAAGKLFAMIFFSRRELSREIAQRFLPLSTLFKTATSPHIEANRIFAE